MSRDESKSKGRRSPEEIATDNARQAAKLLEKAQDRVEKAEREVEKARPAVQRAERNLAYVLSHPDLPAHVKAEIEGEPQLPEDDEPADGSAPFDGPAEVTDPA